MGPEMRMPPNSVSLGQSNPRVRQEKEKMKVAFPSWRGVKEDPLCVSLTLACCQPDFFKAGGATWREVQGTGGLCLGPSLCAATAIPMETALITMLELVFMLADTEKRKSWAQTTFCPREKSGRRGEQGRCPQGSSQHEFF